MQRPLTGRVRVVMQPSRPPLTPPNGGRTEPPPSSGETPLDGWTNHLPPTGGD